MERERRRADCGSRWRAAVAAAVIGAAAQAFAGGIFTPVITSDSGVGAPYDGFSNIAVNANGTLAFVASNDGLASASGARLVTLTSGGALTQLASSPSSTTTDINAIRTFEDVDINANGAVSLRALYGGATTATRPRGVLAFSPGGATTVIVRDADGANAPNGPFDATMGGASINSSGNVLHQVRYDNTALGRELRVYNAASGTSTVIANSVGTTTVEGTTFASFGTSAHILRDNGDVIGYFNYDRSGGQPSTLGQDGIYYYSAANGQIRTLLDDTDDVGHNGPYQQYTSIGSVNASGVFATVANNDLGDRYIVKYDTSNDTFSNYADNFGAFDTFQSRPIVSDAGFVVFQATLDDTTSGIFAGPDPSADSVIKIGDSLFGGTVTNLTLGDMILSDGTLYFSYFIDLTGDGVGDVSGIASTIVPEPATVSLLAVAGLLVVRSRRGR